MKLNGRFQRLKNRRGAVMVEAAIGIPLFLLFTLFSIDMARVGWTWVSLNSAVHEAARWGSIGSVPSERIPGEIESRIRNLMTKRGVSVKSMTVSVHSSAPGAAANLKPGAGISGNYLFVEGNARVDLTPVTRALLSKTSAPDGGFWLKSVSQATNE